MSFLSLRISASFHESSPRPAKRFDRGSRPRDALTCYRVVSIRFGNSTVRQYYKCEMTASANCCIDSFRGRRAAMSSGAKLKVPY